MLRLMTSAAAMVVPMHHQNTPNHTIFQLVVYYERCLVSNRIWEVIVNKQETDLPGVRLALAAIPSYG